MGIIKEKEKKESKENKIVEKAKIKFLNNISHLKFNLKLKNENVKTEKIKKEKKLKKQKIKKEEIVPKQKNVKLVSFWDNVLKSASYKFEIHKKKMEKIKKFLKFEICTNNLDFSKKEIFENHFDKLDKKIIKSVKTSTRNNLEEKKTQTSLK